MPALTPVPNIGSQTERAIIAWLYACYGAAQPLSVFYFSNDWRARSAPLIDVFAHKSTEEVVHSRRESFAVSIEAKYTGVSQPGSANPDQNWKAINDFVGVVMAAMSQSDNGQDYAATALQITQAGRRLAVFGTAAIQGATQTNIANNSDMADFYCDYVQFKGSQRGKVADGELFITEIRHFEVRACNVADDSVFPALAFDGVTALNWNFSGALPDFWVVEKSVDGLAWAVHTDVTGDSSTVDISGTGTQYWRVRRSDDGVSGVDPESNIVRAEVV